MPTSGTLSIFYTGATGYVGGHALQHILAHPEAHTFNITALVRNPDSAKMLESKFNVKAVVGSLKDLEKLRARGGRAPSLPSGTCLRHEKTGDTPILIHVSGAGFLIDDPRGMYASPTITSDLDIDALDAIPSTAVHHAVDLLAIAADTEGYARTYIRPLFEAGVAKRNMDQVSWYAKAFLARGRAGVVGKGACIWADVHIDDTAELLYLLFNKALTEPAKLGHGREGYYFAENGEHSLYALCKAIGTALVEERAKIFGSDFVAFLHFTNARCRADRARRDLGWKPVHTTEELYRVARKEVEAALTNQHGGTAA
ncbi:NAD(P)-binding protein [Cerioporus squamosus]|nr:NAD(P)-binding protein [Cerioporus squamosus]